MKKIDPSERAETARNYFMKGYNCCQSVVMAFSDVLGCDAEKLEALAVGFGGGMGRLREVCGAFSAMVMLSGSIAGCSRAASYALVQEFAQRFRDENHGHLLCRDLLGLSEDQHESPVPSERNKTYYENRPCADIVAGAARIIAEKIREDDKC